MMSAIEIFILIDKKKKKTFSPLSILMLFWLRMSKKDFGIIGRLLLTLDCSSISGLYICGHWILLSVMHFWLMNLQGSSLQTCGFLLKLPVLGLLTTYLRLGRHITLVTRDPSKRTSHIMQPVTTAR